MNTEKYSVVNQEKELRKLVKFDSINDLENLNGGSALSCVIVGGTIAASIALCPTTKCTSQCGRR